METEHRKAIQLDEIEILRRYVVMERHFQRCINKSYFPSLNFYLNYSDDPVSSLKVEAENMLAFVGLGAYTAKIKIEDLKNAAGRIKLTADMYAEITLDNDIYKDVNKVLSTLAHEICHKVLYMKGIYWDKPMDIENEIFADLTTFYVGFGHLTMKGYLFSETVRNERGMSIHEKRYGYLTSDTYGMAYHLINLINGVIYDDNYKDLPAHAQHEIDSAKKRCVLSTDIFIHDSISSTFKENSKDIARIQLFFDLTRYYLDEIERNLQQRFQEMNQGFYSHTDEKDFEWHKISMAYQYVLFKTQSGESYKELSHQKKVLIQILDLLTENWVSKSSQDDFIKLRKCPICKNNITKQMDLKSYHLICPKCKSHFVVDNDKGDALDAIIIQRNIRYSDQTEYFKLKEENLLLNNKLKKIETQWWYKLFSKLFFSSNQK